MQDLYKGFKKVSEDNQSAMLEHENGHRLNIAKSGLSRRQKAALHKLPLHQAKGSEQVVPVQTEMQPESNPAEELQQIGAQMADSVAENLVKGAMSVSQPQEMATEVNPLQSAIEQDQQQMLEPNAMDVQTGQPVQKLAGITPTGLTERERQLVEMGGGTAVPVETLARQSEAEAQREAQKPILEEDEELNRMLARETLAPEAPAAPQVAAPKASRMPAVDLTRPVTAPAITRPPEEVMVDPNVNPAERANAFILAAANIQKKIEESERNFKTEMQKPENMINRDRVFENMSTGKRIRTIIGMLLGGMSAGILKTENPVIKLLNDEIERDVNMQQKSREEKVNLFKQNIETLKDARTAYFQTTNNLRTLVELELEEAKRKLDPKNVAGQLALQAAMTENRAKIAKGNEELTKYNLKQQYAQAAAQGKYVEIPDDLDERRDRIVRVPGPKMESVKLYARTPGMVKELQDKSDAIARAKLALKNIAEFNRSYGWQFETGIPFAETEMANAAETLNKAANFAVQGLLASKALTPRTEELIRDIFPVAGAIKQKDAKQKQAQSNVLLNDELRVLIKNNLTK